MSLKQQKQLELLDKLIQECTLCDLYKTGRCKPYHTPKCRFAMVLEAPGKQEVVDNTPVVGEAGNKLWEIVNHFNFEREEFLIINAVNCRPVDGNRNGKPTKNQVTICRQWLRKYLKVVKPEKIIVFGNYSLLTVLNENGIMKSNATKVWSEEFNTNIVRSVHPAYMIYNPSKGKIMLYESLKLFKEI